MLWEGLSLCVCVRVWATDYKKLELSQLIIHLHLSLSLSRCVFFWWTEVPVPLLDAYVSMFLQQYMAHLLSHGQFDGSG